MRDFFIEFLLPFSCFIIAILLPTSGAVYWYNSKSCSKYETVTGRKTDFQFFGGCFVKDDSGWLTQEEYGKVIIAREGLRGGR